MIFKCKYNLKILRISGFQLTFNNTCVVNKVEQKRELQKPHLHYFI